MEQFNVTCIQDSHTLQKLTKQDYSRLKRIAFKPVKDRMIFETNTVRTDPKGLFALMYADALWEMDRQIYIYTFSCPFSMMYGESHETASPFPVLDWNV